MTISEVINILKNEINQDLYRMVYFSFILVCN